MANSKKIKLETIGEKAKKKKDFLIVISIVSILTFLAISIGLAFMNVNKKKVFKSREKHLIANKSIQLIPERDFKENWAISVENTLTKQNKILIGFMKQTKNDINSTKNELKNMIIDSIAQEKELINNNAKSSNKKIKNLKMFLQNNLQKQKNRIEEIAIMKSTGSLNIGTNSKKKGTIKLGANLLPPLPTIEHKKSIRKNGAKTIDEIIGQNTEMSQNSSNNNLKINKKAKPRLIPMKISLVTINTKANKKRIFIEKRHLRKLEELAAKKNNTYHVMLGLSRAYMITGAYAPAFSAGNENPLPVLLEAEGNILIANNDTESVNHCFLIGSAKGNMNSQTADIRLVKISCSLNGGKQMIEGPISGWVIGENGIPGVPGVLLHKNGAWLARTFVAGFMQTFSQAFASNGRTQISFGGNVGGQQTQVPLGQAVTNNAESAAGGGLSTVFGKLGNYYLKMAQQIFPVIEVKAGRTVNILLKGGENLQVKNFNKVNIGDMEEQFEKNQLKKQELAKEQEYISNNDTSNSKNISTKTKSSKPKASNSNNLLITE